MSRSHSNGLDPPSNQISRNMSDGMADSRNETLAEVQALQKLGINVNPADLVDDDSYCEVVGVARPEEQPYNVPQSQLNMDALVEDVKLLVHCNLLCDVSKFMGGSPIEQLNTEMAKITQWGLTYEYMAQILQHKYENFDLKKKERLLKHPMFGQIVEVVLLKNEYMYKAKSTPRLKELYRQLHSAYNCQMIKRRFNEKQKRTMLKLMSPNERRASMHFCNYLNDLIIRMILRFKKIENIHNVPPDEFEETGVSYQKIDNLHRAIVAEKENGQNSDLYTKYAAILEFDKLTFKEMVKKYGTRSSIVRVLDNVPLFNPIRHINDPKREILHLYIPKNSKQPPYSSEEILQCQLFDLEVDDEAYTVGRGGANGNEDLLHGSSGGNHRGRPSSPVARRANNYLDVDDLSDSDGDNLYSDEEEKMTEEQKEEWRRVQMEKERRREERKGMQKRALEHMRMEGHRRMIAEEQHRARYGENTFFTSLVNPHARIQPPAIEVIRRESCCSSSTNTTATGDGNESKRRNQPALLLDDSMFDKESTVRTHVNPDSPSRRKQVRVDTPSIVGLDQYPAYSSSTDEDLDEVTVRKLSPVQEPEQHTFVCDPAKLPLIVKFIISSSYLLQVWMNSSGILISTLRKLSVLFTPNEVSLFNGHLPSDLHLQLIRKGCQVELIDGEHSISVPLTANSSAFSFSHYVQMLVSAAKLARFTNSPQSLSSLHEHFGLPEVSELLADDSIEKELSTLMQLQDVRIDDNGHIQIDNP